MKHFAHTLLAFLFLFQLNPALHAQTQPKFITDSLDKYVARGLKDWQLPGLAVVVVKDGKVVVMRGYGSKDATKMDPVDENTLFMIASNTKLFTGTALAQLEYQKKIKLNDKVTKYFPDYRLYDSLSTIQVSIRDLLSHRIGTKTFQGDLTFWNGNLSRQEIMHRMRLLKPVGTFRQDYGYCNSCYLTAGQVIEKVTGRTWEAYITDSIIRPLGMMRTFALSTDLKGKTNVAKPYTTAFTGKLIEVPYDNWDNLAPAASIVSNVKDLSHWLMLQLDSGKYNGRQVLPWAVLQKTRDVNIVTGSRKSSLFPTHIRGYGLGLGANDYNGRMVYSHTGGAGGMVSYVGFVPEEGLGIAILTNNDDQSLFTSLGSQILDAYLGVPYVDRSQQMLTLARADLKEQLDTIGHWKSKIGKAKPTQPLTSYAGTYRNTLYGTITVTPKGKQLLIDFSTHPALKATLDYLGNEEWLLQYNNIGYGIFKTNFTLEGGKPVALRIKANDYVEFDAYEFRKE